MDLSKIKTKNGSISPAKLNSDANRKLKDQIWELTAFLPEDRPISQRVYCIENNITEIPKCPATGEDLKWNANKKRFSKSRAAAAKNRNTNFEPIKRKYKAIYQALNNRYRNNNYKLFTISEIIDLYNYKHNIKAWDIEKNYDLFCSILYHTSFLPWDSKWGERIYCIKNNITARPVSVDGGYKKYINSQIGYSKHSTRQNMHEFKLEEIVDYFNAQGFDIIDDIAHLNNQYKIKIECKECKTQKSQIVICQHWKHVVCNKCTGSNRSSKEDEIINYIKSFTDTKILTNYKIPNSRLEIDIYLPEFNIGIEYHGILWHSFGRTYPDNSAAEPSNKTNHLNKFNAAKKANIKLLQIFSTEWKFKRDIVKSMIKSKMSLSDKKIYARKCDVRFIDKPEKSKFLFENHIQGNCQSCDDLGLFYNEELVAVMTFSNRLLRDKNCIELSRFAVKRGYSVVGGFSKLLKNYRNRTDKTIISYCDLRYSSGDVYEKNGFKLIRQSPPNYFYTQDLNLLESRHKYQKKKLEKYDNFSHEKTETQIMYENGFRKIYDAGNLVFEY